MVLDVFICLHVCASLILVGDDCLSFCFDLVLNNHEPHVKRER